MRLTRPRFTVCRLMVAVAIAALAFEVESWRRRYPHCQGKAARWAVVERFHLRMADDHGRISDLYRKHATNPKESFRYNEEQAAFFARAALGERAEAKRAADRGEAYRRAARQPWLAIPPDDPEPMGSGRDGDDERGGRAEGTRSVAGNARR